MTGAALSPFRAAAIVPAVECSARRSSPQRSLRPGQPSTRRSACPLADRPPPIAATGCRTSDVRQQLRPAGRATFDRIVAELRRRPALARVALELTATPHFVNLRLSAAAIPSSANALADRFGAPLREAAEPFRGAAFTAQLPVDSPLALDDADWQACSVSLTAQVRGGAARPGTTIDVEGGAR